MNERKLTVNGIDYVRADLVPANPQKQGPGRPRNKQTFTVLSFGRSLDGLTMFLRLKRGKHEKFKQGQEIYIKVKE